jgi:hypothetical protein
MNDDRDALPDDVRALLRAEGGHVHIPDDARARLAGRLAGALPGFGPVHLSSAPAAIAKGVGSAGAFGALKAVAIVLALGAAGAVSIGAFAPWTRPQLDPLVGTPHRHATTRRVPAPHVLRVTTDTPDVVRMRIAPNGSSPAVSAPPPQLAPLESLREERQLLDHARDAITNGAPEAALGMTARYVTRFPHGILAEEADALRIRAFAHLGRAEEARALLARMRAAHPQSFLLEGANADLDAIP